jgi:hypothetical protein
MKKIIKTMYVFTACSSIALYFLLTGYGCCCNCGPSKPCPPSVTQIVGGNGGGGGGGTLYIGGTVLELHNGTSPASVTAYDQLDDKLNNSSCPSDPANHGVFGPCTETWYGKNGANAGLVIAASTNYFNDAILLDTFSVNKYDLKFTLIRGDSSFTGYNLYVTLAPTTGTIHKGYTLKIQPSSGTIQSYSFGTPTPGPYAILPPFSLSSGLTYTLALYDAVGTIVGSDVFTTDNFSSPAANIRCRYVW